MYQGAGGDVPIGGADGIPSGGYGKSYFGGTSARPMIEEGD